MEEADFFFLDVLADLVGGGARPGMWAGCWKDGISSAGSVRGVPTKGAG